MKLHANHRTCPSSRRLICRRVLEEGLDARPGRRGRRLQRTRRRQVAPPLPRRRSRSARPLFTTQAKPQPSPPRAGAGD
jgi:hypothetical protein